MLQEQFELGKHYNENAFKSALEKKDKEIVELKRRANYIEVSEAQVLQSLAQIAEAASKVILSTRNQLESFRRD